MRRFTITQLLMGTALIAIILVFAQTEGCGTHYAKIESLSFSSDDTRILVSNLGSRDAQVPGKAYLSDMSRTISWIHASDGETKSVVQQDFIPKGYGLVSPYFNGGQNSVQCDPKTDRIIYSVFGGCDVIKDGKTLPLQHTAYNIAISKTGRLVAALGEQQLTILNGLTCEPIMQIQIASDPFPSSPPIVFTDDETCIVVMGWSDVEIWDISTATKVLTLIHRKESAVHAVVAAPNDNLILCSDNGIQLYNQTGQITSTIDDVATTSCCISTDGNWLAAVTAEGIAIYDLRTLQKSNSFSAIGVSALAINSDGSRIAVGDHSGRVSLINTTSTKQLWRSEAPIRQRLPWTAPLLLFALWIATALALCNYRYLNSSRESKNRLAQVKDG